MEEFLGERIEVEQAETSPQPVRFKWHGQMHDVKEVLQVRVDTGYGDVPAGSRQWYTRRHRRYYIVRDSQGDVFEMYLDYANRRRKSWWLIKRWDSNSDQTVWNTGDQS